MLIARFVLAWMALSVFSTLGLAVETPEVFEKKGLVLSGTDVLLEAEKSLPDKLKEIGTKQRELIKVAKVRDDVNEQVIRATQQIEQMKARYDQLNDQLGKVDTVSDLGKIESEMNKITKQVEELTKQKDEKAKKAADDVAITRSRLVEHVLAARAEFDKTEESYKKLAEDDDVSSAIKELSEKSKKEYKLGPSDRFAKYARDLSKFEEKIDNQEIEVRFQQNVAYVDVIVNGKKSTPMVFDSGASVVLLPHSVASDMGITVADGDESIALQMADGRTVEGKLKVLDSVRIGKFTVESVECAVLGPEYKHAECLLGGNVLQEFAYSMDRQAGRLTLTRVAGEERAPSKAKKGSRKRKNKAEEEEKDEKSDAGDAEEENSEDEK